MNNLQASRLFDLAAGLRSLTTEIVTHVDDPRPSPLMFGLAVAAENLANQLADATWEMVETATDEPDTQPDPIIIQVGTADLWAWQVAVGLGETCRGTAPSYAEALSAATAARLEMEVQS